MQRPNQRPLPSASNQDFDENFEEIRHNAHLSTTTSVDTRSTRVDIFPPPPESVAGGGHASLHGDTQSVGLSEAYDIYKDTPQYRQQAAALADRSTVGSQDKPTKSSKRFLSGLCVVLLLLAVVGGTVGALVQTDDGDNSQSVSENTQPNDSEEQPVDDEVSEDDTDESEDDIGDGESGDGESGENEDDEVDICVGACIGIGDGCCDADRFNTPILVNCSFPEFISVQHENQRKSCLSCTEVDGVSCKRGDGSGVFNRK